jgi:hypothetical protein
MARESISPTPRVIPIPSNSSASTPHAAFVVESLDQAIKGKQVILPPTEVTPTLRVAFIKDGDALVEVMEMKE